VIDSLNKATLTFEGVRFAYEGRAWALGIPKLSLGRERMTCIVGPNGSGKSTLLRIAAGILPPLQGAVRLWDQPLPFMSRRAIAQRLAFLPQETPPLFDYTVEDIAQMGRYAHLHGVGQLTDRDFLAVEHALSAVEMAEMRNRPLSHLSGGERRRALIASVLAQEPDLLLLDEPTASLDIHHAAAVMRLLSGFKEDRPSVVVVTHDMNLAALFSTRLLLLVNGQIQADGTPSEVIHTAVIQQAYGEHMLVMEHPETGSPMMVALRQDARERSACHA